MDKPKTIREILENLCHNTMGNPPHRIDQAEAEIKVLFSPLTKEEIIEILNTNQAECEDEVQYCSCLDKQKLAHALSSYLPQLKMEKKKNLQMNRVRVTVDTLFGYCNKGDEFILNKDGGISTHCWEITKERVQRAIENGYLILLEEIE